MHVKPGGLPRNPGHVVSDYIVDRGWTIFSDLHKSIILKKQNDAKHHLVAL